MLSEIGDFEKAMTAESIACNSCYLLCKRLLQQSGEDLRPAESIVELLNTKLVALEERVNQCVDSSELALLQTALFLGKEMLADHAVTFPMVYQRYVSLLSKDSRVGTQCNPQNIKSFCFWEKSLVI